MDRLTFQISERVDYLQHTISPYIESSTRFARNALSYVTNQSNLAFSNLLEPRDGGIPFHTWISWQWSWFVGNCRSCINSFQQSLAVHYSDLGHSFENVVIIVQQKCSQLQTVLSYQIVQKLLSAVDQSHIYFLLSGVTIGFIIGIQIKQNVKPLTHMRALVCNSYAGAPESIAMIDDMVAPSSCGTEDVLIQVKATSIDPMDIKITFGYGRVIRNQYHHYHKPHGKILLFPFVLGRECSGRIVEIGSKVQHLDVGDEVYAAVPYYACGTASECALIPAQWVAKKPRKLSYEAAASLPFSASVVWNALVHQASFNELTTPGKRVLIHSVDNPVGCIAAQLVKAWGGHVTATVSSRGMITAQQLGIDDLILHDGQHVDFDTLLSSCSKFDLVLNTVGSILHDSCRSFCCDGGVVVSTVASPPASDKYGLIYGSLYSVWLRIRLTFLKDSICGSTVISKSILDEISNLVNKGQLQPVIERVFEINQAEQAGQYAAKGDHIGKIIIRFRNRPLNRMEGLA